MLRELQQEIAVLQATKAELQAKIIIKDTEHRILIQNYAAAHAVPPVALSCTTSSSCVLGVMSAQRQLHEALRIEYERQRPRSCVLGVMSAQRQLHKALCIEYERQRARGSTPQVPPTNGHLASNSSQRVVPVILRNILLPCSKGNASWKQHSTAAISIRRTFLR